MAHHHPTPPNAIIDHKLPYDTHNTYDVIFFGEPIHTTVTCDPTIAAQWISDVEAAIHRRRLHQLIVGLDIEWRPPFSRDVNNPAATLQLCVGRRCLIFQLIHSPFVPPALMNFLANPCYTFVGSGIKHDVEKLEEDHKFGFNTNTVDLRELAATKYERPDLKKYGLKSLASLVLEKEMEKPKEVTLSCWDKPPQVHYACVDAFVSFEIGRILNASSSAPTLASASRLGVNYRSDRCITDQKIHHRNLQPTNHSPADHQTDGGPHRSAADDDRE
ncbi:hypothetical protein C2S52_008045, partial [Perilla frutescens var. hirtella]